MSTFSHALRTLFENVPRQAALHLLESGQPDQMITYDNLIKGSAAYEAALRRHGIVAGEVVVLILQHGRAQVDAYFGAILHGVIPSVMPFLTEKLLPERYRDELAALIEIIQPAAIITYAEFETEVRSALKPDDSVRAVIVAENIPLVSLPAFDTFEGLRRAPEDIALLQHSSGTTGLQKGVALSHKAVFNQLKSYSQSIRLMQQDVIVSWLPLYHDMGLIAGFLMPVLLGIPLVLMSPFEWVRAPYKLMQAISRYRGTLAWLPNFAYNFCAQKVRDRHLEGVDLSTWRAVINCSEPVRWESHQLFLERFAPYGFKPEALAASYAMAENVFAVTQGGIDAPLAVDVIDRMAFESERRAISAQPGKTAIKMVSNGPPIPNVRVRIVSDDGRELSERQVGEIALQSDCMLTGYYRRPDETQQAFQNGWYLTGDYGYLLNGELYVSGRKKDLIIVGGKNIYPQDLERLAMAVDGVHPGRVVAFGIFDETSGTEEVVIVAEVDTDDPAERSRIVDGVHQAVRRGSAVVPRKIYLVDARWLIKTSSGKTARAANCEKYLAEIGRL